MKGDALDPKGLIEDAYRIEGITAAECRSIFLDWALSVPGSGDTRPMIKTLLERHAAAPEGHPMTVTLREGLQAAAPPKRRGGRAARIK